MSDKKCKNCNDHGVVGGMYRVGASDVDVWEEICPDCGISEKTEKELSKCKMGYIPESVEYNLSDAQEFTMSILKEKPLEGEYNPIYNFYVRNIIASLEDERDKAREHGASARIRENKAEDERVSLSLKLDKKELENEELKRSLKEAQDLIASLEKDNKETSDIMDEAIGLLKNQSAVRHELGYGECETIDIIKWYHETKNENERLNKLLSMASAFTITDDRDRRTRGTEHIEVVLRDKELDNWCVSNGRSVLNTFNEWEWEPSSSDREDDFIDRTRFSLQEAIERGFEAIENDPLKRSVPIEEGEPLKDWNTLSVYQNRVGGWLVDCFGRNIAYDQIERMDRFMEEAIELVQSLGYSASRVHALVRYVFSRPVGEPLQELGGTMVTLASLCYANCFDLASAAETELRRISTEEMKAKIRAKQKTKPTGSALPIPNVQIEYCQPPELNGEASAQKFVIIFDDPDESMMVFENEETARETWQQMNLSWNCQLLGTLEK